LFENTTLGPDTRASVREDARVRVLCISNLYPPVAEGGYELGCADVMRELSARGHAVRVLTSDRDASSVPPEPDVSRTLPHFFDATGGIRGLRDRVVRERRARRVLADEVASFRPDVVYFFNTQALSRSLLFEAQERVPVCVYVSDPWYEQWRYDDEWLRLWSSPEYVEGPGRKAFAARCARAVAKRVKVPGVRTSFGDFDVRGVHFTSKALRDVAAAAGRAVADAPVVHWGVDPARFTVTPREPGPLRRLLFVGRVIEPKGVHVAIDALALARRDIPDLTLTVVGPAPDPEYNARLRALAADLDVLEAVTFAGPRPRDEVVAAYAEHDALVLPSIWPEPFSITLLEAMASGRAVVVADTGGSAEIVVDGENGLLYDATDAVACARALTTLKDPATLDRLARNARREIEDGHSLARMVDKVEALLAARLT
jgi:glycosyltransferase involved in cell wall biosynthesis